MEEVNSLDLVKNRVKSSQLPEIPLKKYLIVKKFLREYLPQPGR